MEVLLLGPVAARHDDRALAVDRPLERALLARLALAGRSGVPDERLVTDLWEDDDGAASRRRLRVLVSRLRQALGPASAALVRSPGRYVLAADVPDLEQARLAAQRLQSAVRAGDAMATRDAASAALATWRGPVLGGLPDLPFVRSEISRLDAWWLELTVHRLQGEIDLGSGSELVDELSTLIAEHPLHEPLCGMLAVALYRCGRQGEALAALATLRAALADELGVDPTPATADLELRLLRQDPGLVPTRTPEPAVAALPGRAAEITHLDELLTEALAGQVVIALVEGEAGIGKTRLLEELDGLAERRGQEPLWGRAATQAGAPPLWPWRQVLRAWRRAAEPAVLAAVDGQLDAIADPAQRPTGEPDADARFAVFEQLTDGLVAGAHAAGGLVVVLDDLHWADQSTLLLLGHIARAAAAAPLFVAAGFRPAELRHSEPARRTMADLVRQRCVHRIELAGLPVAAVAEQLAAVTGRPCAPATATAVAQRSGGNPLFVGAIGQMLAMDPDTSIDRVPAAVSDTIRQRLEVLSQGCRSVLSAAAVLSSDIDADLLAIVARHDVDEIVALLDEAEALAVVRPGAEPGSYRFQHDLVRDCLHLLVPRSERAQIHLRAAEHLAADRYRLAHHLLEALPLGNRSTAVGAAAAAAESSLADLAFEEAARLFGRAAAAAGDAGVRPSRPELLLAQARALLLSHDVSGAMALCETVAGSATDNGDAALLGQAALLLHDVADPRWLATVNGWCRAALELLPDADDPLRAQLLAQLAVAQIWTDDDLAEGTSTAAMAMAERTGDPAAIRAALRARQLACSTLHGAAERLRLGDRMLGLAAATGESATLWGRLWRFDALMQLGRLAEAAAELDALEPVVARMRQPMATWHLQATRAMTLAARGDLSTAAATADNALRVVEQGRHETARYPSHALRIGIALLTGADVLDPDLTAVEAYHPPPRILSLLSAEWHTMHGQRAEAERLYAQLPPLASIPLKPFMRTLYHACHGTVAGVLGDPPSAEHAYRQLLPDAELFVTAGAGPSIARGSAHLPLGLIAAARDDVDAAVSHLGAAVSANTRAGFVPWAAIAHQHLAMQLDRRGGTGDGEAAARHATAAVQLAGRCGMDWLVEQVRRSSDRR